MRICQFALLNLFLSPMLLSASCTPDASQPSSIVHHRDNCLVCHQPLASQGVETLSFKGIEDAHPWSKIPCTVCHGGNPRICDGKIGADSQGGKTCDSGWVYDKTRAHVSEGSDPKYLKNLTGSELDNVDKSYLQFINPGDFRVADKTCGRCHEKALAHVQRSRMAHISGEIAIPRVRARSESFALDLKGASAIANLDEFTTFKTPNEMQLFDPEPLLPGWLSVNRDQESLVSKLQDQYMAKSCFSCHLNDFGDNKSAGNFRSSGCSGCHMPYRNDGLSHSADTLIAKDTVPHPEKHQLAKFPKTEQCVHCHYRGGRIGMNFQGIRESAAPSKNPPNAESLGQPLHGHDSDFYLVDEDLSNDFDETPPDVHFKAGMHCVDCHGLSDVHGDGRLPEDLKGKVAATCESCHGDARNRADADTNEYLTLDGDKFLLRTKVTELVLEVPQVLDSVTLGHPLYSEKADIAMGVDANGKSHTDEIECYTCHSAWIPTCYGCHVTMDYTQSSPYRTTGDIHPGKPRGERSWIQLNDLILMKNHRGKLTPSMPAERFFMNVELINPTTGERETIIKDQPRRLVTKDGTIIPGFGQRPIDPHTTQKKSSFSACDRCHTVGSIENPDNIYLMDITHGFGSERFLFSGCDIQNSQIGCDGTDQMTYRLDALIDDKGTNQVLGYPEPKPSRPLTLEEIHAMREISVTDPGRSPPRPADPFWPSFWPQQPEAK